MRSKANNIRRLKLCMLASVLEKVLRSRGNVVVPPPEKVMEESHKDFFDSLRKAVVHDAAASRTILMNGFSDGNGKGASSFVLSVSVPMKKNSKTNIKQKNKLC